MSKPIRYRPAQKGFTLIEVMLVIVIIGIFAAMVGLSIGGSDVRRVMQEREQLMNSIAEIRLESQDQGRMLGLVPFNPTASDPAGYIVVQYDPNEPDQSKRWKPAADFKAHPLPDNVALNVTVLQDDSQQPPNQAAQITALTTDVEYTPQIIWFGNGEATAARLQLLQDGQPVGDAVEVTTLGSVKKDDADSGSAGANQ